MQEKNRRNLAKIVIIFLGIFTPGFIFLGLLQGPIYSATSDTVNLQGKIVRNDAGYEGLNVTDGYPACVAAGSGNDTCDFRIRYYDASTAGNLLLTEDFSNIEIGQYVGVFNLALGSDLSPTAGVYTSLSDLIQGEDDVYVEVGFDPAGSNTYTEVFTRMPLQATGYAIRAKHADTATGATELPWSGLKDPTADLSLEHSTYTTLFNWATGTGTDDLFTLTSDASATGTGALMNIQTGTGSSLIPFRVRSGATEAIYVNSTGNVGMGTTSLTYKLEVDGDTNLSSGSVFRIGGASVLSSTTLGSGVTGSSLTSVGTLTSGIWNASTIEEGFGGTGQTTYATGDILFASGANTLAKRAIGTNNQVLTVSGGVPVWSDVGAASSVPFSGITSGTNTTAAMVVGAGASLNYTSTGTINASSLQGGTWASPGTIGSTTPNTGAFTTLSASTSVTTPVIVGNNGVAPMLALRPSVDNAAAIQFRNAANTVTTLNVDTTNSRVGIGTTSPSTQFHTTGGVRFAGISADTQTTAVMADTNGNLSTRALGLLAFEDSVAGDNWGTQAVESDSTLTGTGVTGSLLGLDLSNPNTWTGSQTFSASTYFPGSGIWDSSGNIGVGTTTPGSKLSIVGTGSLFNISSGGTDLFTVTDTQITSNLPHAFTSSGDVSMAYNLYMTNQSSSKIESYGPLSIIAGESYESNDLTLKTYNAGKFIVESSNFTSDYTGIGIGTSSPSYLLDVSGGTGIVAQFSGRVIGADAVNTNEFVTKSQLDTVAGTAPSFADLTSGTNTTAAMVVGAGASLNYTSTGTINASSLQGSTWAVPAAIGSTTPNSGAFTSLTTSTGITNNHTTLATRMAATSSAATQIPVFTADPSGATTTLVTRTPAQLRGDIGAGTGDGTVTSVGLSMPSQFSVTGSPVTDSGTLTAQWQAQAANSILAGPGSGGDATPTFRALVNEDIPSALTGKTYNGLSITTATDTFTLTRGSSTLTRSGAHALTLTTTGATNATFPTGTYTLAKTTDLHSAVTLAGNNYLTLSGQEITAGDINLASHVTGVLPDDNGGTGQSTYATGDILYASGANTLAKRAIGSNNQVLTVSGGVPVWSDPGAAASVPFSGITSGTNTSAAMTVDTGASLTYANSGTINASSLQGSTWAIPPAIGSTTPNTGAFTSLGLTDDITFNVGNEDVFIDFNYTSGGYGWRMGYLGTGSGNANYLTFQSENTTEGTFTDVLRFGQQDYVASFVSDIVPLSTDQDLGTTALRWDLLANTINADSSVTLTGLSASTQTTAVMIDGSGNLSTRALGSLAFEDSVAGDNWGTGYWTLAGDTGTQTINENETATIAGGTGLTTLAEATRKVTINLDNTAVTPGSYGDSITVGTFTVDQQGRLTAAGNTTIRDASGSQSGVVSTAAQTFAGAKTFSATPFTLSAATAVLNFSSTTGTKSITTGGTTHLNLAPGGNVGIGTATPGYKLDVNDGTGIVGRFSGRVIGADAVNTNEFVTKSQLDAIGGTITTYWQRSGTELSPVTSGDSVVPSGTASIGSSTLRWNTVYGSTGNFTNLAATTLTGAITGNSQDITGLDNLTGATSTFSTSISTASIIGIGGGGSNTVALRPASNAYHGVAITNATGIEVLTVDTINNRVGIGLGDNVNPSTVFHTNGGVRFEGITTATESTAVMADSSGNLSTRVLGLLAFEDNVSGDNWGSQAVEIDSNNTLTGDGTLTTPLSLNLANVNTWTGAQTFDTNTYFPGSGIWDSSGNVGIGTQTPGSKLHVSGSSTTLVNLGDTLYVDSTNKWVGVGGTPDTGFHIQKATGGYNQTYITNAGTTNAENQLWFSTGYGDVSEKWAGLGQIHNDGSLRFTADGSLSTPHMTLLPNGNFGIGTVSPSSKLTLYGSSTATTVGGFEVGMRIANTNTTTNNWQSLVFGDTAKAAIEVKNIDHTNDYGDIALTTRAADGWLPRMYIQSAGNVGIGNSAPASLFSVGATSQFQVDTSGDITKIKNLSYTWPTAHTTDGFLQNNGTGGLSWAEINAVESTGTPYGSATEGPLAFWTSSSTISAPTPYGLYWDDTNQYLGIGTNTPSAPLDIAGGTGGSLIKNSSGDITIEPAEDLIISQGDVGIGTTNPLAKLHVKGNQILLKNEADADVGFVLDSGSTTTYRDVITFRDRGTDIFALEKTATNAFQLYDYAGTGVSRILVEAGTNSGIAMRTKGTGDFSFINDTTTMVTIDDSGRLGIGTTSPDSLLEVSGTRSNTIAVNTSIAAIGGGDVAIRFGTLLGTPNWGTWMQSTNDAGAVQALSINPLGGNVGIGTSSPSSKLEVSGDVTVSGNGEIIGGTSWGFKEGPSSYSSTYRNNWSAGGGEGTSIDCTTSANACIINDTGTYEVRCVQRASSTTSVYIGIGESGNRSTLENRTGSMWNHDHSSQANMFTESNYIGVLYANETITCGPPSSATGLVYATTGYAGTLSIVRIR